jgi:hypothetical protein
MYQLANNVLGTLKYDIAGGGLSIVVAPISGRRSTFRRRRRIRPRARRRTASRTASLLMDRLDLSQAKYEIVIYSARAAELAGAFTYTIPRRPRPGDHVGPAWTAGAYILQVATENVLAGETRGAVLRAEFLLVHKRDAVLTWDGSSFKFDTFVCMAPAAASTGDRRLLHDHDAGQRHDVKGFGGASTRRWRALPFRSRPSTRSTSSPSSRAEHHDRRQLPARGHDVGLHGAGALDPARGALGGDRRRQDACGSPRARAHALVRDRRRRAGAGVREFVGGLRRRLLDTAMRKLNGDVELRGLIKSGVIGSRLHPARRMAAGLDPAHGTASNAAFGMVQIDSTGGVNPASGNNTYSSLFGIRFRPEG